MSTSTSPLKMIYMQSPGSPYLHKNSPYFACLATSLPPKSYSISKGISLKRLKFYKYNATIVFWVSSLLYDSISQIDTILKLGLKYLLDDKYNYTLF